MLKTPETPPEGIPLIDDPCDGFIYMVSAASTPGPRKIYDKNQLDFFRRISNMNLRHNRLIGFGISNSITFDQAQKHASGAIIGSQFIRCLDEAEGNPTEAVDLLLSSIGK